MQHLLAQREPATPTGFATARERPPKEVAAHTVPGERGGSHPAIRRGESPHPNRRLIITLTGRSRGERPPAAMPPGLAKWLRPSSGSPATAGRPDRSGAWHHATSPSAPARGRAAVGASQDTRSSAPARLCSPARVVVPAGACAGGGRVDTRSSAPDERPPGGDRGGGGFRPPAGGRFHYSHTKLIASGVSLARGFAYIPRARANNVVSATITRLNRVT